jgi:hypothetical protein
MIASMGEQRGELGSLACGIKDGTYFRSNADLPRHDWWVQRLAGLCAQCCSQRAEVTQSAPLNLFELFRLQSPLPFCADYVRESELPVPS